MSKTVKLKESVLFSLQFKKKICLFLVFLRFTMDQITRQTWLEHTPVPPCWEWHSAAPLTISGWSSSRIRTTPLRASSSATAVRILLFYRTEHKTWLNSVTEFLGVTELFFPGFPQVLITHSMYLCLEKDSTTLLSASALLSLKKKWIKTFWPIRIRNSVAPWHDLALLTKNNSQTTNFLRMMRDNGVQWGQRDEFLFLDSVSLSLISQSGTPSVSHLNFT